MKPQRPYFFDAIYRWILDNNLTPYLLVNAEFPGVEVPEHLVKDGRIVLNISPEALANFSQDELQIRFSARFSGKSQELYIPFPAMIALYSKEDANGMVFPPEDFTSEGEGEGKGKEEKNQGENLKRENEPDGEKKEKSSKKPSLKVVK